MIVMNFTNNVKAQEVSDVASGKCGENIVWSLDSEGLLLISGSGKMDDYNYGINPWESYVDKIKSISINDGVENIGDYAFYKCVNLTNINIPDSVIFIGRFAFQYCSSLANVIIPDGVTEIRNNAFEYCSSIENIEIPSNVTYINWSVFSNCKNLTSITIPSCVTMIGCYAFDGCSSLESIKIPQSITNIEDYAFRKCNNLKYVFYSGASTQWDSINIEKYNTCLTSSAIHYSATDHIWNSDYTVDTESTCVATGSKSIHCSVCNVIKNGSNISIPVSENHITELRNEKEPTYVSTGYTGDQVCTVCGKIIESGTVIPMKERIEATGKFALVKKFLQEKGRTDDNGDKYFHNIVMVSDKIGAITTITYIEDEAKFQFAYGNINNNRIESTIAMFIEENGSQTVTVDYSHNIFSINASAIFDVVHYTSGGKEYFEKTSSNILDNSEIQALCNATLKSAFTGWDMLLLKNFGFDVNMADMGFISYEDVGTHTGDGVVTKKPTCTEKGVKTYTCVICGFVRKEAINMTQHQWNKVYTIDKKATNTTVGLKSIHCSICGAVKKGSEQIIPKLAGNVSVNSNNNIKNQTIKSTTSKKISEKKVKKKAQSFKLSAKSTSGIKVQYKLVKKNRNIKFASSSGKVTVKKGTKKGTYKIKVKMTVSENNYYKSYSTIKTITIKVK